MKFIFFLLLLFMYRITISQDSLMLNKSFMNGTSGIIINPFVRVDNRKLLKEPERIIDSYNYNKIKVVIAVKVDKYGNVIEAIFEKKGTTTSDKTYIESSVANALKEKFIPISEDKVYVGTIIYTYFF